MVDLATRPQAVRGWLLDCDVCHSGFWQPLLTLTVRHRGYCVMLTRTLYSVRGSVGPLAFLVVGLIFTVGWIGLLAYGFLALIGY